MAMSMIRIYNRNHVYLRHLPLVLSAIRFTSFSWASSCLTWLSNDSSLCVACDYGLLTKTQNNENGKFMQHRTVCLIYMPLWDASGSNTKTKLCEHVNKKDMTGIKIRSKKKRNMRARRTEFHSFFTIAFANGKSSTEATLEGMCVQCS